MPVLLLFVLDRILLETFLEVSVGVVDGASRSALRESYRCVSVGLIFLLFEQVVEKSFADVGICELSKYKWKGSTPCPLDLLAGEYEDEKA